MTLPLNPSRTRRVLLLGLLALLGIPGCGPGGDAREPEPAPEPDPPGVVETAPGRYEATIWTYNWGFDPAEIHLPAGAHLTVRVRSRDDFHGFQLVGTNLRISSVGARFTPDTLTLATPGEYEFMCDTYCGAGHETMKGKLVVHP